MNVVITGASTGIGRATALRLEGLGHRVFAAVRKPADADALRAASKGTLVPLLLDVTDVAAVRAGAETVGAALGNEPLHGIVNNAGVGYGGPVEFVPLEDWRRQFEVNVFGAIAVVQAFTELLRRGPGRIVNVGSIGGLVASPFMGPYCASKFAMEALSDTLRLELKPWGIEVVLIEPGAIKTPIWDKAGETAAGARDRLGPGAVARYGSILDVVELRMKQMGERGIPPERVAEAIERGLTARRPPPRIKVGTDARIGSFVRWLLPDRWFDAMLLRAG